MFRLSLYSKDISSCLPYADLIAAWQKSWHCLALAILCSLMPVETQKCTVLSCAAFVIIQSIQSDFSYFFLSRD